MKSAIGLTIHYDDETTLKITIDKVVLTLSEKPRGKGGGKYEYLEQDNCPTHGPWHWVKPGTRADGSSWDGFWTCDTERGAPYCTNRPGRQWLANHPSPAQTNQLEYATPPATVDETDEYDSLPF